MKTLFLLYRQYTRMDLLWFLRDTKYCLIQIFSDLTCALCTVSGVLLLSERFGGFGSMSQDQILFMMAYATVTDGIHLMFFAGYNTSMISRIIGRGQLDHCMVQPVPLWMQLLAQGFSPFSGSAMLICGLAFTGFSVQRLGIVLTPGWLILAAVSVICSSIIILSVMYLFSCAAFYAPAAAEEIAQVGKDLFSSLKTYPLGSLGRYAKTVFLTVLPIGLASWFPSAILTGAPAGVSSVIPAVCFLLCFTVLLALLTIILFRKGLKHYETYGSPRYSGFGHR